MAFKPPAAGQERQNRKIIEQLEEQKKRLRLQNQPATPSTPSTGAAVPGMVPVAGQVAGVPPQTNTPMLLPDTQAMTPAQRTALQELHYKTEGWIDTGPDKHANANSVGYFITQDSSFGNLILPVLPRF